jgi:glutaredoxin-related protein
MPTRPRHDQATAAAIADMEAFHSDRLKEIQRAVKEHDVVVIGMALNGACGKAVKALEGAGYKVHYIEIGGYFSKWRERLAIKLWSGWPLYPQVFVKGTLIGGRDRTIAALADGTIQKLMDGETSAAKSAAN